LDTAEPFDDAANPAFLQDATNVYFVSGAAETGALARPGFTASSATVTTTAGQASCLYTITTLGGTVYRFFATNGKLYRLTGAGYTTATDVTPVGVTISNAATPTTRMYMVGFADELIFTDGVNRPWRGTDLSATPITGTYIDIDGAAGAWTAQGAPVVYSGTLFFIAKSVPGGSSVEAGVGMIWSEPFQPETGYVQSTYANFWNLIQTSAEPLYALWATNTYLYYFREKSIGALVGSPGVNFSTTASADSVSTNIGSMAPASICQFGENIYFADALGRPNMFSGTDVPQELYLQLDAQIDANPSFLSYPASVALTAISVVVPQLNLVLMGPWSSSAAASPPLGPTTLYCFDGRTGQYYGRWIAATACGLTTFDSLAQMKDSTGAPIIAAYTTKTSGAIFSLSLMSAANWKDNTVVPSITIQTQRLGYSATEVMNATEVGTVVVQGTAPLTITVKTPYTSSTTEATAIAASSSSDGTYLVRFGMDVVQARGIQVTLTPTTATAQWICQHITFPVVTSQVRVDDQ
jgi:hypothetical protein